VLLTFTPLEGMSEVVLEFLPGGALPPREEALVEHVLSAVGYGKKVEFAVPAVHARTGNSDEVCRVGSQEVRVKDCCAASLSGSEGNQSGESEPPQGHEEVPAGNDDEGRRREDDAPRSAVTAVLSSAASGRGPCVATCRISAVYSVNAIFLCAICCGDWKNDVFPGA
jgi:hypothetical protein